jgi:dienelactone hydrolase
VLIQQPDPSAADIPALLTVRWDPSGGPDGKGGWIGTLDVPPMPGLPGAVALPFSQVEIDGNRLLLGMTNAHGGTNAFQLEIGDDPDHAEGHFVVNGVEGFALRAQRVSADQAAAIAVQRPQNPRPPLPYRVVPATITSPAGSVTITGTLTIPEGDGPFPGVLLVNDFGPRDRDRTGSLHRPYLVLADRFTREGFAVLRTDDRGVGGSAVAYNGASFDDLVADARAARAALASHPGVDPGRIGVLGWREGAPIAAAISAEAPAAAFLVLMVPQGVPGAEMLAGQFRRQLEVQGEDPAVIESRSRARLDLLRLLASESDEQTGLRAVADAVRADAESRRGEWAEVTPPQVEAVAAQFYMTMTLPRMRPWLSADPAAAYRRVVCPTLVVAAGMDLLSPPAQNVPPIEAALRESPAGPPVVRLFPRANFMLQPAATGLPDEAVQIRTTIDPAVLDFVADWIRRTAGR